jgi:hypothetical protein
MNKRATNMPVGARGKWLFVHRTPAVAPHRRRRAAAA